METLTQSFQPFHSFIHSFIHLFIHWQFGIIIMIMILYNDKLLRYQNNIVKCLNKWIVIEISDHVISSSHIIMIIWCNQRIHFWKILSLNQFGVKSSEMLFFTMILSVHQLKCVDIFFALISVLFCAVISVFFYAVISVLFCAVISVLFCVKLTLWLLVWWYWLSQFDSVTFDPIITV